MRVMPFWTGHNVVQVDIETASQLAKLLLYQMMTCKALLGAVKQSTALYLELLTELFTQLHSTTVQGTILNWHKRSLSICDCVTECRLYKCAYAAFLPS